MVIQHTGQWLHQLVELEELIKKWEELIIEMGIEDHSEDYLRILIAQKMKTSANDLNMY